MAYSPTARRTLLTASCCSECECGCGPFHSGPRMKRLRQLTAGMVKSRIPRTWWIILLITIQTGRVSMKRRTWRLRATFRASEVFDWGIEVFQPPIPGLPAAVGILPKGGDRRSELPRGFGRPTVRPCLWSARSFAFACAEQARITPQVSG